MNLNPAEPLMETPCIIPYAPRPLQWRFHQQRTRFCVLLCHRRFGKTVAAVNDLLRAALRTSRTDWRAAYAAPYLGQAKAVAWDYLRHFAGVIPGTRFHEGELRCDLPNGARIRLYGTDNAQALRGLYLDDLVLDEPADMPREVWSQILRPALADRQGRRDAEADAQAGGALQTALARAQLPHPDVVRGQMAAVTEAASRDAVGCGRPFRPGLGGQHGRVMGQALAAGLVIVQHAPGAGGLHLEEPDGRGVVHAQVPGRMHGQVGAHRQGTDASRQIGGIQQGGIIGPAHSGGEGTFEFLPVLGLAHAAAGGVQLGLRQVARLRGREAEA